MQGSLATTSMFTRLFVVYETHLVHAMHLQMNLEWFCIWTFFLDVHDDVFETNRLSFSTTNRCFWNWAFALFPEAACFLQQVCGRDEWFWNLWRRVMIFFGNGVEFTT